MYYSVEDKIKSIEQGIKIEKDRVERLQKELSDWTLSDTDFVNKRKVLNSTRTFIKKLEKDILKLKE